MAKRPGPRLPPSDEPSSPTTSRPAAARTPAPEPLSSDDSSDPSGNEPAGTANADTGGRRFGQPSVRRMAGAFSQQLVFRVVGMLASIVMLSLTVRHLGGTSYGHLTTAIMFISLWTSLTELGIGAVIVRRVTGGDADLGDMVRLNTGLSLVYCVPLSLVSIGSGLAIYAAKDVPEVVQIIPIIGLGLTLTTISSCFNPVFLSTVRFTAVAISDVLGRVLSLALTIVLIRLDAGVMGFALVQLIPPVVVLVVQGYAASRLIDWRPTFDLPRSWDLIRESLPQTGVLIIGVLYWRLDGVMLSLLSSADSTATYYVAYTFAFTLSVLPTFFLSSTLSTMTRLFAEDRAAFTAFTTRGTETMLFIGVPIAAVGAVLSGAIITAISAEELTDRGGATLALLFVAVGVTFVNSLSSQALFASHQQTFLLRLNVVNLGINVVLNVALIPQWGAVGAALALVVTETIGLVVTLVRLNRLSGFTVPWMFLARLSVSVVAAAAAAELIHVGGVTLVPAFTAAVVVYLAVNVLIGPVRISTVRALLSSQEPGA